MNINRENYEVYFLDYLEGNLSAEQVADLLVFVQENSDLKEEFDMLKSDFPTLDSPEEKVFPDKSALKHSEPEFDQDLVNMLFAKKLEEDLSDREETELNLLMEKHPQLHQQWKLFAQLKLTPTDEEFLDKSSLKPLDFTSPQILMAAAFEGDLDKHQKEAFELLIQDYGQKRDWELMQQAKLTADKSIAFFGKDQLKKKVPTSFAAWRNAAAVAAMFLMLFTGWQFLDQDPIVADSMANLKFDQNKSREIVTTTEENAIDVNPMQQKVPEEIVQEKAPISSTTHFAENQDEVDAGSGQEITQRTSVPEKVNVNKTISQFSALSEDDGLMKPKEIFGISKEEKRIFTSEENFLTIRAFVAQKARQLSGVENQDEMSMTDGLMTKAFETISEKTNGEVKVDLKDDDQTESDSRGWKVKIGKLELSHKRAG